MTEPLPFREIRDGGFLLLVREGIPDAAAAGLGDGAGRGRRGEGKRLALGGVAGIRKRYRHGGILGPILGAFQAGPSRAFRELKALECARRRGVPAPAPLAAGHAAGGIPLARREFLITAEVRPGRTLRRWLDRLPPDPPPEVARERNEILEALGRAIRRLHDAGIHHRDLQLRNVILEAIPPSERPPGAAAAHRPVLVDFDRARRYPAVPGRVRIRALARLLRSAAKGRAQGLPVRPVDGLRILRAYAGKDLAGIVRPAWRRAASEIAWHSIRWRLSLVKGTAGRYALEFHAARILLALLGRIPAPALYRLGGILGRIGWIADRGHRRIALANLSLVLGDRSDAERRRIARDAMVSMTRTLLEIARVPRLARDAEAARARAPAGGGPPPPPPGLEIEGREHYDAAAAPGRPILFVTGHLGAWELMPAIGRFFDIRIGVVARPLRNTRLARYLLKPYREQGAEEVVPKRGAIRSLLRRLRSGRHVGMLVDQAQRREGILATFLGRPATTIDSHALLSIRFGLPILPIACLREGPSRYRLVLHPPLRAPNEGSREARTRALVQAVNDALGALVLRAPDQYMWLHQRWKIRESRKRAEGIA